MGRDVHSNRLAREFRDKGAEVLGGHLLAGSRGDPETALRGITAGEHGPMCVDVCAHYVSDEFRYLTLVNQIRLCIVGRDVEPPSAIDIDE
jgi:hypothetical protein